MNALRAWWLARDPRERRVLGVGAVAAAAMLVWAFAYKPVNDARRALIESNQRLQADLMTMHIAARQWRSFDGGNESAQRDRAGQSLLALADAGVRRIGLGAGLKRIEPAGDDRVRLRLEAVPFDPLAAWLEELALTQGIIVAELSATRTDYAGQVDVQLVLQDR